jgi:hypothetical protein
LPSLTLVSRAAAFGSVRCVDTQELDSRQDILFSTIDLGIWSFLESNVTIIAACIPPLYSILRKALGNSSRPRNSSGRGDGNTYGPYATIGSKPTRGAKHFVQGPLDLESSQTELNDLPSSLQLETPGAVEVKSEGYYNDNVEPGIWRTRELYVGSANNSEISG